MTFETLGLRCSSTISPKIKDFEDPTKICYVALKYFVFPRALCLRISTKPKKMIKFISVENII